MSSLSLSPSGYANISATDLCNEYADMFKETAGGAQFVKEVPSG